MTPFIPKHGEWGRTMHHQKHLAKSALRVGIPVINIGCLHKPIEMVYSAIDSSIETLPISLLNPKITRTGKED
jgi:hypothetical protein